MSDKGIEAVVLGKEEIIHPKDKLPIDEPKDGGLEINKHFFLKWSEDDAGTFNVYIIPADPSRSVFHGVIYTSDEGGYTKFDQGSEKAQEVVADLIEQKLIDPVYLDEVVAAKETKRDAYKIQRIAELEAELAMLKSEKVD